MNFNEIAALLLPVAVGLGIHGKSYGLAAFNFCMFLINLTQIIKQYGHP